MYYNHFIITGCLTILLFVISYKNKSPDEILTLESNEGLSEKFKIYFNTMYTR